MDNSLKTFYDNETQREAVKDFIIKYLRVEAVKRVMKREDTSHIADAHDILLAAFINLKEIYGEAPKPSTQTSR